MTCYNPVRIFIKIILFFFILIQIVSILYSKVNTNYGLVFAEVINCKKIKYQILEEIGAEVKEFNKNIGRKPGLVIVMVGENSYSKKYASLKAKTARDLGFYVVTKELPKSISESKLIGIIRKYNNDERIHGIILQPSVPNDINAKKVFSAIAPDKDVDCMNPINFGKILIGGSDSKFLPPIVASIKEIIQRLKIETKEKEIVIVGRSTYICKPLASMFLDRRANFNSKVTVVPINSTNLFTYCKRADILIVEGEEAHFIKSNWIKPNSCVIDLGVYKLGSTYAGNVDFEKAKDIAAYITPVPSGIGILNIPMLMKNTLTSFKLKSEN